MILKSVPSQPPELKTITLADGQTFGVLVAHPTHAQRFNDEGRELMAYSNAGPDAWSNYRLGRIRDAVVDWEDVTNDKGQPIPFTTQRLFGLMDSAPEIVQQLVTIANEVFAPFVIPSLKSMPDASGEGVDSLPKPSESTSTVAEPSDSPAPSESAPQN